MRTLTPTLVLLSLTAAVRSQTAQVEQHQLAAGTPFATRYTAIDSGRAGPTILICGGVHGNEPAGPRAARQIAGWNIQRGKLLVLARANQPALNAKQRRMPGLPKTESDLNRQFPTDQRPAARGVLATAIWDLVAREKPDYLIDLHEGFDFTRKNSKSVGSSVIATKAMRALARKMIEAVDKTITAAHKKFTLKNSPILGSLARSAHDHLGIPSMIVETTTKGQALAFRVRQHRILVHSLLRELAVVKHGPDVMIGTAADKDDTLVALYVSTGVSGMGPSRLEALLTAEQDFAMRRVCASDIRAGVLSQFDTVVFPGGSGSGQAKALGASGRKAVTSFVHSGGGYLGICAGAYLAANNYDWSLRILDANVIDRAHWRRGTGEVPVQWTASAKTETMILYANGPIYQAAGDPTLPDFEVLAIYRGEIRKNKAPIGIMRDTPAIVTGSYGKGTVVCSSPHPELTAGLEATVRQLARRAAGK